MLLAVAAVLGLCVAALAALAGRPLLGVLGGLVVGAAGVWWIWAGAETRVLRAIGARAVSVVEEPGLHNVVEGLCASAGLPKPGLWVVDGEARNALSVGRDPRRASIVVTRGLLDALERIELEGVLAHELAHVKVLDSRVGSVAAAFAPLGSWAVTAVVGPDREESADAAGVAMTRYPPGLLRALAKLTAGPTAVTAGAKAAAHLWLVPGSSTDVSFTHRIDALRELS